MSYPKVEKLCVTCQYQKNNKCICHDTYISYQMCFDYHCKDYQLDDAYKKGGKFYEEQRI